ncbi:hypothetical protein BJV74DRAFT_886962 [Russula compacta]|nr:hypothetical protein BJV74DRAFT_886962 [Russula compacta]
MKGDTYPHPLEIPVGVTSTSANKTSPANNPDNDNQLSHPASHYGPVETGKKKPPAPQLIYPNPAPGPPPRPAYHNTFGQNPGNQLSVGNPLPVAISGRVAGFEGSVQIRGQHCRADINIGADGRPKGSGTVIFETAKDAQQAIIFAMRPGMLNEFDWYGRILEVREDRYAGLSGPGGYRGGFRGRMRGLRGGLRGSPYGGRGGF